MYANSLYGEVLYGNEPSNTNSENTYVNLISYLPDYYQENVEMNSLQTILGYKIGDVSNNTSDTLNQCFVSTATWGLARWEKILGISTDPSKPYAKRREIISAKLRGAGTTTKAKIRNVAIAFSGGEVSILEYPGEYRFVIQFIGIKGIPQNMAGLIEAINEIKPAHLSCTYKYTYTTWNLLNGLLWGGAEQKTWAELRIYEGE